jgi:hypothetical protein
MLCFARDKCIPNVSGIVVRILDEQLIERPARQALITQFLIFVIQVVEAPEERADVIDDISQSFKLLGCKGCGGIDRKKRGEPCFCYLAHSRERRFSTELFHFFSPDRVGFRRSQKREWRKAPCQKRRRGDGRCWFRLIMPYLFDLSRFWSEVRHVALV